MWSIVRRMGRSSLLLFSGIYLPITLPPLGFGRAFRPSAFQNRSSLGWALLGISLVISAGCGGDERDLNEDMGGGPVRVFAVGLRSLPEDMESLERFKASIHAIIDAEVRPHLATDRPNFLVFPENTGLLASFIGERGATGRSKTDSTAAFLELYSSYQDAIDYYVGIFGEDALPLGKRASMAPTDILMRSLLEVFAELAKETGAWVAVTYNIAETEEVEDSALAAMLTAGGEAPDGPVYRAKSAHLPNQTLIFDPEGELHSRHEKEYLVPAEESALQLDYGPLGNLGRARLPFGEVGVVISKDAWMPDVLDRLALSGVNLLLQPEAFSGWTIEHADDPSWSPDVVNEGGYAAVMKYAEFKANVLPCLSMNFFDLIFDCQSAVWVDPHLSDELKAFVGQDPMPGFGAVAPWVIDDPQTGSLDERRAILRAEGEKLLPGGSRENDYAYHTAFFDLDLGAPFPERSDGDVELLAPSDRGEQRRADAIRLGDGTAFVAFEDTRDGASAIYGLRIQKDGRVGEARKLVESRGRALRPRLAESDGAILLVFQDGERGERRIRFHRSKDRGESFDQGTSIAEGEVWVPAIASEGSKLTIAFVDMTSGASRVHLRESDDGGLSFGPIRALEPLEESTYDPRQNQWAPSVARSGDRTAIAFIGFHSFAWGVYAAFREPGEGPEAPFSQPVRVDDAFDAVEPIHSDPQIQLLGDGSVLLAHTDLRVRKEDYDARFRRIPVEGEPTSFSLASSDTEGWSQWRPFIEVDDEKVYAVFQDFRRGRNQIRYAISSDGGISFSDDRALVADSEADAFSPILLPRGEGLAPSVLFEATGTGRRQLALRALPH